jgi:hypothetical protein
MIGRRVKSFFNPERFQGWNKKANYFEGWYFKVVNADRSYAYAFIPGIAMDGNNNRHSFIQALDGIKKTAKYHKYNFSDFSSSSDDFTVEIKNNKFAGSSLKLDLPGIKGELKFEGNVPWPKPFYSPGIMGPYAFVPFMECYHGVVSMDHSIEGSLCIDGKDIDFTGGRGYIEKDWGKSFPSAYIWMQSNHFSKPGISLKASVAKIPWLRSSFVGFIAGILINNELIRFTTYNKSKLHKSLVDKSKVTLQFENSDYLLDIVAHRDAATGLASPILGLMDGRIEESMTSEMIVTLTHKNSGETIFTDTGKNTALEVAGNISEIITSPV